MYNSIIFITFALSNNKNNKNDMKVLKTKEVIKLLEADGWYLKNIRGDHRQFVHPTKKGKVTVNGPLNKEMDQRNLNSIWKQAGWK